MKYISVTAPGNEMSDVIFNYFNHYLISIGEAATSTGWQTNAVLTHTKNILKEKPEDLHIYLDSGGFQIIVGYIEKWRINEYIQAYHLAFELNMDKIENIFSLDVFNGNILNEKNGQGELFNFNKYSIDQSIDLIKRKPEAADKQLFVLQTSNSMTLRHWKKLVFDPVDKPYEHFKRWSIGGLVGLKKATNARFSHAVPATLWFLTYQKILGFKIDQIHWLGQSSRLSFLSMGLFERIYNLNMTSDSSALVRFAPIDQKLPLLHRHSGDENSLDDGFDLASEITDIDIMLKNHSFDKNSRTKHKEYNYSEEEIFNKLLNLKNNGKTLPKKLYSDKDEKEYKYFADQFKSRYEYSKSFFENNKILDNADLTELQAQGVNFEIEFANMICDKIMDNGGIYSINTVEDVKSLHPIMTKGRVAVEFFNNIEYFKQFENIIKNKDFMAADKIMFDIVDGYKLNSDYKETISKLEEHNLNLVRRSLEQGIEINQLQIADDIVELRQEFIELCNKLKLSIPDYLIGKGDKIQVPDQTKIIGNDYEYTEDDIQKPADQFKIISTNTKYKISDSAQVVVTE